jgi:hypothetical protein
MRCHRRKQQRPFPFLDIHGTALVGFFVRTAEEGGST